MFAVGWKPSGAPTAAWAAWLALAACAGCASTSDPATGDLQQDLRHKDPRIRMESAFQAAEAGRRDLVGLLIENLRDRDDSVRYVTGIALKRLTGRDFDYRSHAGAAEREKAVELWKNWGMGLESAP